MTQTHPRGKINKLPNQPFRIAGTVVFLIAALVLWLVYQFYSGDFVDKTKLTMLSDRAGLVMDPGSKVTYNGVQIGRVADITEIRQDGKPAAKFTLDVYPKYLHLIPANVETKIVATTVFGEKYVSMTAPKHPLPQRITPKNVIDVRSVTTEINTLFQTITSIAQKVDPVKVNLTLSAAAQALSGLGDKFGQSLINGSATLDEINPRMPIIRHDIQQLATLGDTYANAAPDLLEFLNNAATTAHTIHAQEKDLDRALLAATGFGATGADIFNRGGPYLARGAKDLVPSAQLLDTYSPALFCGTRNLHDAEPKVAAFTSPYSLRSETEIFSGLGLALSLPGLGITAATMGLSALTGLIGGAPNPYVYPENLPRVNGHGGPGGAPGCWQSITRDLWPAPTLIMDTGNSLAPYNHVDTGSPYAVEYVWGRQVGDHTINP
ncbi:MAG: phospholipid/cholesterol/gamma-HCH transport system substrate-binding protein [Mycobacterium sp.]|jgi:phospholipid/cholesterol/gamma-HCH transport system substrate-binding protein|nr:phospholipid/cholesterol/gamma-HCH transport system substrate-binding protein [Mycobacterium sp.]MDT5088082.1 phospholipid/cholesterol/gamma-HCH transport system substrate-binding protein [Mycobacterium sp.]